MLTSYYFLIVRDLGWIKQIIIITKREATISWLCRNKSVYLAEGLANVAALDEESIGVANDQPIQVRRWCHGELS